MWFLDLITLSCHIYTMDCPPVCNLYMFSLSLQHIVALLLTTDSAMRKPILLVGTAYWLVANAMFHLWFRLFATSFWLHL